MNRRLPANMAFVFVRKSRINGLISLNSKSEHLNFFCVDHFNISHVNLTAPGNSPNTDGIKIGMSNNVKIRDSHIGSGDDCIAISLEKLTLISITSLVVLDMGSVPEAWESTKKKRTSRMLGLGTRFLLGQATV
ncbi:BnaC05g13320D [Brassica napus]|uniref:BnaC05g13320D protein n=2 Tax=Brassica napus TaxID=3708 RepID=A0A078IEN1_BRANA|nr:BnaC05g13320D [Brassica napus]